MKYLIMTIKDRAVEAYQPIACTRAEGEAIRGFQDAINNPQNGILYNHPDDYDLYLLGTFDDETGEITAHAPQKLADGKQMKITQGA